MRRREFFTLVGGAAFWPLAAWAQETGRTYRVGGLSVNSRDAPIIVAMFDELRSLVFIVGQNLTADWRAYEPRTDLVSQFEALGKATPMLFTLAGPLQFARPRRRRPRYRSSGLPTIWSGLD